MLTLALTSVLLYTVSRHNYLLFHALTEGFAIVIAALIAMLGIRTFHHTKNRTFLALGIAYAHVALFDFVHVLTYEGMGVFPNHAANTATQLWIAGRLVEAFALCAIPFVERRPIPTKAMQIGYALISIVLLSSIMVFNTFPECFVEGVGLTPFKKGAEYLIIAALLTSAYFLKSGATNINPQSVAALRGSMLVTALSEIAFTLYSDVYGVFNALGHILKVLSYWIIYKGTIADAIDDPVRLAMYELRQRAIRDPLTGLYNRQGMADLLTEEIERAKKDNRSVGTLMIDLDNFKHINDAYGHVFGDEALMSFGLLLQRTVREHDRACRYGGDEFLVLANDVDTEELVRIKRRIREVGTQWIAGNPRLQGLGISIGMSLAKPGQRTDATSLINMADKDMYMDKQNKPAPKGAD